VYAKWTAGGEGTRYELTPNPYYDDYNFITTDFLPQGFTITTGEQITISFSIKTDTAISSFGIAIGDWGNYGYGGFYDDWIAADWPDTIDVPADGQFHWYRWVLPAAASAPVGPNPLQVQFSIDSVSAPVVAVYIKDVSVTKMSSVPSNLSLAGSLTWITNNAVEGGEYMITVRGNETIAPRTLSYSGKTVGITIKGDTAERTVSLSTTGSLFIVESGVTLTLDNNITLQGRSDNTASLVSVNSGGTLVMNTGSKVTGNTNNAIWSCGGGIFIDFDGTFTMFGGIISDNSASFAGGGVYATGTFIMSGGTINGNTSKDGGGVRAQSTFTMSRGTISGNTGAWGGGVGTDGTFTMSGGTISGNTGAWGGGVDVYNGGTFTKQSGGMIYGSNADSTLKNTATSGDDYGHAVYTDDGGKKRNTTAGSGVTLNSGVSGSAGGWEDSSVISNITYSSVLGGTWTLLGDGRRQSPAIGHNSVTKARVSFTSSAANASITIQLEVSSEAGYDFAFISTLDNVDAAYNSGYYNNSVISGANSVTVSIPVPGTGSHFIEIGYRKDGSTTGGSDCAWFKVIQ
jgi:hypothetical protein